MDANELIEHLNLKFTDTPRLKNPKDRYVRNPEDKYGIDLDGVLYKTKLIVGWGQS